MIIKPLTEDVFSELTILQENKTKNLYIEGIFLQADVKNRNGRMYPLSVTERAVGRYNQDYIQTGRSLGELGHPPEGAINLHLASHKIESLKQDGKNFIGKAKLLDTPMGKIAKELIKEGVRLGVSLRGYGSLSEIDGANVVGNDFVLTTVDIVADPSAPEAFVTGVMENTQKYLDQGLLLESDYSYIQTILKNNKMNEDKMIRLFESMLNKIK